MSYFHLHSCIQFRDLLSYLAAELAYSHTTLSKSISAADIIASSVKQSASRLVMLTLCKYQSQISVLSFVHDEAEAKLIGCLCRTGRCVIMC